MLMFLGCVRRTPFTLLAVYYVVNPVAAATAVEHEVSLLQRALSVEVTSEADVFRPEGADEDGARFSGLNVEGDESLGAKRSGKRRKQTVILMADSRDLFPNGTVPSSPANANSLQLAAALNLQYARKHGYDLAYVRYVGGGSDWSCAAMLEGQTVRRHPSWCKLLATSWAARGRDTGFVFFVDSDAFFYDQGATIEHYTKTAELMVPPSSPLFQTAAGASVDRSECSLFSFNNDFFDLGHGYSFIKDVPKPWNTSENYGRLSTAANAGILAWPLPIDRSLLSLWWKANRTSHHRNWEQDALNVEVISQRPRSACMFADRPFTCSGFMCHASSAIFEMALAQLSYLGVLSEDLTEAGHADHLTDMTFYKQKSYETAVRSFFLFAFVGDFNETMHALRDDHLTNLTQDDLDVEAAGLQQDRF